MLKKLPFIFFLINICFLLFSTPVDASDGNQTEILQSVVAGGINTWAGDFAQGLVTEAPISENGTISVFAPITAPIEIVDNEENQKEMEANLAVAIDVSRIIILLIALFILLQELKPKQAREIAKYIDGEGAYYEPVDTMKFAVKVGAWFMFGSLYLYAITYANNDMISDMNLGVLDQIIVSSDNLANFLTLGLCTKALTFFMSIRDDILLYSMRHWFFLGIALALKKSRWIGVLYLQYITVLVFVQALIVGILTSSVTHVLYSNSSAISDMGHYAGTSILLLSIVFVAATIPIWIKYFNPRTFNFIIGMARRA